MPRSVVSGSAIRDALRKGDATGDQAVRKVFIPDSIKAEGDESERTYTFTISTGVVDRERDVIAVEGWKTESFLKAGGPVLWAHDIFSLPIGKAPWVKVDGGALKARVEFAPPEVNPFAEQVRQLVEFGAIKAASVGFRPLPGRAAWNEERNGIDFLEQELLEFSLVPVPANPDALLDAKAAGVDVELLRGWAEKVLNALEPGLWLSKDAAERALTFACATTTKGKPMRPKQQEPKPEEDDEPEGDEPEEDKPEEDKPKEETPKAALYPVTTTDIREAILAAATDAAVTAVRLARGRLD